jgi:hypothetical protein
VDVLDLRRSLAPLYSVKASAPVLVQAPELSVLAFDGVGDPAECVDFRIAIESLFALAWGIRARWKAQSPPVEIKVMPLEGQWSLPTDVVFSDSPSVRAQLRWSMQIVQPSRVTQSDLDEVRFSVATKKRVLTRLDEARLTRIPAHDAMTLLHIGPYSDEPATIARIHAAIHAAGGEPSAGHREIYLSDPRRISPDNLKTILRVGIRSR